MSLPADKYTQGSHAGVVVTHTRHTRAHTNLRMNLYIIPSPYCCRTGVNGSPTRASNDTATGAHGALHGYKM